MQEVLRSELHVYLPHVEGMLASCLLKAENLGTANCYLTPPRLSPSYTNALGAERELHGVV